MRLTILFLHVLSAIAWLGGSIYVEALMAGTSREGDETARIAAFRRVSATNRRLFSLAGISTVVFGFWLVLISPGWEFEMLWVTVGILIAVVVVVIDLFYATPRGDRVQRLMDDPDAGKEDVGRLIKEVTMANHARTGLLFVALMFMVFKF